jgi:hypothetical protein
VDADFAGHTSSNFEGCFLLGVQLHYIKYFARRCPFINQDIHKIDLQRRRKNNRLLKSINGGGPCTNQVIFRGWPLKRLTWENIDEAQRKPT